MILESREGSSQYGFMEYLEKNKNLLLKNYLIRNAETCVDVSSGALDFRVVFFSNHDSHCKYLVIILGG